MVTCYLLSVLRFSMVSANVPLHSLSVDGAWVWLGCHYMQPAILWATMQCSINFCSSQNRVWDDELRLPLKDLLCTFLVHSVPSFRSSIIIIINDVVCLQHMQWEPVTKAAYSCTSCVCAGDWTVKESEFWRQHCPVLWCLSARGKHNDGPGVYGCKTLVHSSNWVMHRLLLRSSCFLLNCTALSTIALLIVCYCICFVAATPQTEHACVR